MLAKLQRWVVFSLLLTSIGAATFFSRIGWPAVGIAIAVVIVGGYSLVLAAEFVCLWFVEVPNARPSIIELGRAWWGETTTAPRVFYWRQPFRAQSEPDHLPSDHVPRRGIVLVHGLVCNRAFWNPWLRRLRALGIPFVAVDLEPPFASIEAYADTIDAAMRRVESATRLAPVIVAHSMGGLAVRHWLSTRSAGARVHHLITIGTPHHGTWMARFGWSPSSRQMVVGSDWLRKTRLSAGDASNVTCFYGNCDNIVFPAANAQLANANNRRIAGTAHVALAFKSEVFSEALRWLRNPPPAQ